MNLTELAGWLTLAAVFGAFASFLLKQISREYVKKLGKEHADFVEAYRSFMRAVIRRHRYFGMTAAALVIAHAGLVVSRSVISASGLTSALLLFATAGLGAWGFYGRRSPRGGWLSTHRGLAFVLLISIIVHLFYKAVVLL
ncbi:MAG: hypothetical protein WAR22_13415 [Desulfomonilia bacterium]